MGHSMDLSLDDGFVNTYFFIIIIILFRVLFYQIIFIIKLTNINDDICHL